MAVVVGNVNVLLQPLAYMLDIDEDAPILDLNGQEIGKLRIEVHVESINAVPISKFEQRSSTLVIPKEGEASVEQWAGVDFDEFLGKPFNLTLKVSSASNLSSAAAAEGLLVRCVTDLVAKKQGVQPGLEITPPGGLRGANVQVDFDFSKSYTLQVTKDLQDWLVAESLQFEVLSSVSSAAAAASGSATVELVAENAQLKAELAALKKGKGGSNSCALL